MIERFAGAIEKLSTFLKPSWLQSHSIMDYLHERAYGLSDEQKQQKLLGDKGELAKKLAGGMSPVSFRPDGGSSSQAETMLSNAVKVGMLAAFREWFASTVSAGGGGVQNASYGPSGGSPGGGLHGGAGYSVLPDGSSASSPAIAGAQGKTGPVPAGSGPASGTLGKNKRDVARIAAEEWRAAGMSDTGIAGIMANVKEESSFNPTLRHADQPKFGGEAHFAHGLYQEGGTEWNNYAAWLKQYHPGENWQDPRLQSRFAAENLKKNYPGVWKRLNSTDSRVAAGQAYASGYLKPAAGFLANRNATFARQGIPPLESFTGPRDGFNDRWGNLPGAAKSAAEQKHTVTGDASLNIALSGFPRNTRTDLTYGGLFTQYTLSKGRQMEASEQK